MWITFQKSYIFAYLYPVRIDIKLCLFHNQRTLVFLLYRPVSVSFQSELRLTLLNQTLLHSLSLVFFYSILRMELSLFHRLVVCSVNGWLSLLLHPKISYAIQSHLAYTLSFLLKNDSSSQHIRSVEACTVCSKFSLDSFIFHGGLQSFCSVFPSSI